MTGGANRRWIGRGTPITPDGARLASGEPSFADVVERLFRDYEDRYPLTTIVAAVRECRLRMARGTQRPRPAAIEKLVRRQLGIRTDR